MIDWEENSGGIDVMQVQFADLEDARHVPPGFEICGRQVSNFVWRSPEAHAESGVEKPSNMFFLRCCGKSASALHCLGFRGG